MTVWDHNAGRLCFNECLVNIDPDFQFPGSFTAIDGQHAVVRQVFEGLFEIDVVFERVRSCFFLFLLLFLFRGSHIARRLTTVLRRFVTARHGRVRLALTLRLVVCVSGAHGRVCYS